MFGDYGSARTLKSQFIKGYVGTLLTKSTNQTSKLVTKVRITTSTSASLIMVKRVFGSVKTMVKQPRVCPLCIHAKQKMKELAERV